MGCGRGYRRRRPEETALYRAVAEGRPEVVRAAGGLLPRRVAETVREYLRCGQPRYGFTHVKCDDCGESVVVGFSCKRRGMCPSCGARRAEEAAAHCGAVLPRVAYRQWTVSLPREFRWVVVKRPALFKRVERQLVRAVWRWQRRLARGHGAKGRLRGGAVAFAQLFGSALQLTPHLHVLVPEGVWRDEGFMPLPPPEVAEVEAILKRLWARLSRDFAEGDDSLAWPEDAFEALQSEAVQKRLPLEPSMGARPSGKRLAVLGGFRLHADTWVHENDRAGLERLCRYGSRGPLAEERLSRREDGRYAYVTKRGPTLVLTAGQLVKRLVSLVPPKGRHLTSFHGVFAANSSLRRVVMVSPKEGGQSQDSIPEANGPEVSPVERPMRPPRLDWATLQRRTFEEDVWACPHCGGRRRVLAVISTQTAAEEYLKRLGLLESFRPSPSAQGPPQQSLVL